MRLLSALYVNTALLYNVDMSVCIVGHPNVLYMNMSDGRKPCADPDAATGDTDPPEKSPKK